METKAHHILVGSFVLIMITLLTSSVFWLGRFNDGTSYNYYNVDFVDGVSGLSANANVVVNGITVGKVKNVNLHPDDIRKVRVVIAVDGRIPVLTSTKVSMSLQGVTGFGIEISTIDNTAPLLVAAEGEDLPTINVERSEVSQLLETVPNILRNVNVLIAKFDDALTQNNDTIGKSLDAVETGLGFLIDRTEDFESILKDVRAITKNSIKISQDVTEITTNVAGITSEVSKQVEPMIAEVNKTIADYRKLAASLDEIMHGDGATMITEINTTLVEYKKLGANVNAMLETDDGKLLTDLSAMVENLDNTITEYKAVAKSANGFMASDDLKSGNAGLGSVIDDTLASVANTAKSFEKMTAQLERLIASAGPGINRFSNTGLKDAETLLKQSNETLRSFNRLMRQMESNPQRFLFGDKRTPVYRPN